MKIVDKRGDQSNGTTILVPGTVILSKNKYLLITKDPDIYMLIFLQETLLIHL